MQCTMQSTKMALGELTAEEAFKEMDTKITELAGQK